MNAAELNRAVEKKIKDLKGARTAIQRDQMIQEIQALSFASVALTLAEETKIGGAFRDR